MLEKVIDEQIDTVDHSDLLIQQAVSCLCWDVSTAQLDT